MSLAWNQHHEEENDDCDVINHKCVIAIDYSEDIRLSYSRVRKVVADFCSFTTVSQSPTAGGPCASVPACTAP